MKHYTVGHYSDKPSPWVIVLMLVIAVLLCLSNESWEQMGTWIIGIALGL